MPIECRQTTQGGKGNRGMFIERDPDIVAAGIPSAQHTEAVKDSLQHYLLKDEADALISDALIPPPKPRPLPPLRKPIQKDQRHAAFFSEATLLVTPPSKTKFQILVDDLKETAYKSYWKQPLGSVPDPIPMLPEGFDIVGTTFGKPTEFHGRLYDIVMPKVPLPDKTPPSKQAGAQTNRKYCAPPFNPNLTYGHRAGVDKRGILAKCCLTDDRKVLGTGSKTVVNTIQANFLEAKQPILGKSLAPYNNIREVPEGYSFGVLKPPDNLPECLIYCEMNQGQEFFRKCLKHLNTVRRMLAKKFLPTFFYNFYLTLKYEDKHKTGWLPKEIVYKHCGFKLIRFDPSMIEPLLEMWQAFDGSRIEYKIFVRVINYREPSPEIPKIIDVDPSCIDYRTTYTEMVKPGKPPDNSKMAGVPSGRYLDTDYPITPNACCKADRVCLPHESDARSCLTPSVFTHLFVTHRDMYEKREPDVLRKVFEAAGEKFTDEKFNAVWAEAQKEHYKGWVCFETFRRALDKYSEDNKETK